MELNILNKEVKTIENITNEIVKHNYMNPQYILR